MSEKKQILFVDDEISVLHALRRALRGERNVWHMHFAHSVDDALETVRGAPIDAIVTDITMPERDGFDLLAALQDSDATRDIPVVVLTGLADVDVKRRALARGAVDLLNKPIVAEDLIARLRSVLRLKGYQDELKNQNATLEQRIKERTVELEQSHLEIIWRLAKASEYRDEQTGNHVVRVGGYCRTLAEHLGMSREFVETIFLTSPLHDIGKIGISDTILLKNGPLNATEWTIMQRHCEIGHQILQQAPLGLTTFLRWRGDHFTDRRRSLQNPLLKEAAIIALTHHEKWDGSGYPNGLQGEQIPLAARIVAIADVYDALSHARPYKPAFPESRVLTIMTEDSRKHFDPGVFEAFLEVKGEFARIKHNLADVKEAAA